MAHHKSTKKRMVTNVIRNRRNIAYKSLLKTTLKKVLSITDKEAIRGELPKAYKLLDSLAAKKIIHANKAANNKSRLAKYANSLS